MEEIKREKVSFACISKYRTFLMGLAMLSILLFHFTEDCVNLNYHRNTLVTGYKNYIGSSGVDIFLFLSGFGLYYSYKKNPDKKTFYRKRFVKILIPYFLVAIPAWIIKDFVLSDVGIKQYVKDVLFLSFFQDGTKWMWYILMILICYIIFPNVFEAAESKKSIVKLLIAFVMVTVIAVILRLCNEELFGYVNIALLRFPVFFLGTFVGKAAYQDKKITTGVYILFVFAVFTILFKSSSGTIISRYILGAFSIACFIFIAVILDILSRKNIHLTPLVKVVEWFGNYSLELYLTHVTIRKIMNQVGLHTCRIRYECLLIILAIIASLGLRKLTNFINKRLGHA